jgi:hypothetical protein
MPRDGSLPRARRDGLLEETVDKELLLYDRVSHTAHCLSPLAASVWRHCDGGHDLTGLAQLVGATEDLVAGALHELRENDLLDVEPELQSTVHGVSRREVIGRAARYGAATAAGSMIVSAAAATPAMASSEEAKECCQCLKGVTKCNCGLQMEDDDCLAFCEDSDECKTGSGEIKGELFSGVTCKNTKECTSA